MVLFRNDHKFYINEEKLYFVWDNSFTSQTKERTVDENESSLSGKKFFLKLM